MAKRKNDTKYHEVLKQAAGYSYKNGSPAPDGYKVVKSVDNKDTGFHAEVLAKGTPDFVDDGKGGKVLVLRGADGNVLNNPKNNLNPYTIKELVMETSIKDVVETQRQQTGGGTGGFRGNGGNSGTILDLTGIKTQVEADKAIENYLLSNGLTRDSEEFSEQLTQIRTDNNVSSLPIK